MQKRVSNWLTVWIDCSQFAFYTHGVYYLLMNSNEIFKRLKKDGWVLRHTKGSHHQFVHPTKTGRVTLPHPKKDLPIGTVKNIFSQAGWEWTKR